MPLPIKSAPFAAADPSTPVPPRIGPSCASELSTPPAVVYTTPLVERPEKVIVPLEVTPVALAIAPERLKSPAFVKVATSVPELFWKESS